MRLCGKCCSVDNLKLHVVAVVVCCKLYVVFVIAAIDRSLPFTRDRPMDISGRNINTMLLSLLLLLLPLLMLLLLLLFAFCLLPFAFHSHSNNCSMPFLGSASGNARLDCGLHLAKKGLRCVRCATSWSFCVKI